MKVISMQKHEHPQVQFSTEPDLWPEEFSDCFLIDLNAEKEDIIEAVCEATDYGTGALFGFDPEKYIVFTSDQEVVDELKAQLYGMEIAYRHTHYPNTGSNG